MKDNTVNVDTSASPAKLTFAPAFNVAVAFIDRHVDEGRSDKIAIRSAEGDITYGALAANVNRAGNALQDLGLEAGDRVVMALKDCPAFFYVFWGAIKAGYVPVPVNTLLRANDYRFILENSGGAAAIYSPEFASEVEPALNSADPGPKYKYAADDFTTLMETAPDTLDPTPATADDDCFWLYTSGSTGTPKGGVHAHKDMVVSSQYYGVETLGASADDIHFSAAKLFFAYGLGNAMTFPLWTGGQAVLFGGRPTPDTVSETIETFRPTIYYGVPTLYGSQLHAMEEKSADLSSLRVCVSAGEPLPANIFERWRDKTGLTILDGIGTTEILHIFIGNSLDAHKPGTSGRLVPGYEARIVDDDDNPVAAGEIGNLMIRGASVISRYWEMPERTAQALVEGWIRTGDSYYQDADGYFVCCGRSDDMLKVGGIWVSPVEIEAQLVAHDAVLEAAIVGRPDDDEMIKPEAYVILKDPNGASDALADELRNHCRRNLAPYKYPRWFNFVEELPKTATGKIQRFKLRG